MRSRVAYWGSPLVLGGGYFQDIIQKAWPWTIVINVRSDMLPAHLKRVGLVQSQHHYHLVECNVFSPWYSWQNAHLWLIKQQSFIYSNQSSSYIWYSILIWCFFSGATTQIVFFSFITLRPGIGKKDKFEDTKEVIRSLKVGTIHYREITL